MGIITDYFAGNPSGNLSREFGKSQMYNLVLCPIQAQLLDCSRGTRSLSRSFQGHIPFWSTISYSLLDENSLSLTIFNQPTTNFSPRPEMKIRLKHGLRHCGCAARRLDIPDPPSLNRHRLQVRHGSSHTMVSSPLKSGHCHRADDRRAPAARRGKRPRGLKAVIKLYCIIIILSVAEYTPRFLAPK